MITVEKTATVAATPETVWGLVTDLPRWNEWLSIHQKWKQEVPASIDTGTTVTGVASILNMPNTISWTVDEFDAPRRLALSGTGMAGAKVSIALSVTPDGDNATVSVSSGFEGQMVVGAIAGALERAAQTEIDTSLANLERLVA